MAVRKTKFVNNYFYHIFNRGTDKRDIFLDHNDISRFFQSMNEFNVIDPIGSIYQNSFNLLRSKASKDKKLVNFVCYCLNPNHYHFILEQVVDSGIEKFMQRLGTGYTKFFNHKHKRSGTLFQGKFKAVLIDSNEFLLHVSAYVNLNDKVHQLRSLNSKSSWDEYIKNNYNNYNFCKKDVILDQFNNREEYKKFAEESLKDIIERKEMEKFLLE
ncbi:MAG: transposase [Patescibacteria group bacterium]